MKTENRVSQHVEVAGGFPPRVPPCYRMSWTKSADASPAPTKEEKEIELKQLLSLSFNTPNDLDGSERGVTTGGTEP